MNTYSILPTLLVLSLFSALWSQEQDSTLAHDSTHHANYTSVGYFAAGWTMYNLDDFNTKTQPKGVASLDNSAFLLAIGYEKHLRRLVTDFTFTTNFWIPANNDVANTRLSEVDFSYKFGFDLLKSEKSKLYPYAGVGVSWLYYRTGAVDLPYDSLYTGNAPQDFRLSNFAVKVNTGLGYSFTKKNGKSTIGIKAGYTFDLSDKDNWYRRYSTVADGPSLAASGPYATLIFGMKKPGKHKKCTKNGDDE